MRFILFFCCLAGLAPSARADELIDMPVTATIIDYKTAASICGGDQPAPWCPAHLLRPDRDIADGPENERFAQKGESKNPAEIRHLDQKKM